MTVDFEPIGHLCVSSLLRSPWTGLLANVSHIWTAIRRGAKDCLVCPSLQLLFFLLGLDLAMPTLASLDKKIEVVIVGGSSGALLARSLSTARRRFSPTKYNLTLISQLPYNVYMLAAARMVVTAEKNLDSTETGGFVPLNKLFQPEDAGRVVQGKVTRVTEDHLELADGGSVPYDYLVLATGSRWPGPMDFDFTSDEETRSHLSSWRGRIASAKNIVVVGGGPAGLGTLLGLLPEFGIDMLTFTLKNGGRQLYSTGRLRNPEHNYIDFIQNDDQGIAESL